VASRRSGSKVCEENKKGGGRKGGGKGGEIGRGECRKKAWERVEGGQQEKEEKK